jgi:hypothetical protein
MAKEKKTNQITPEVFCGHMIEVIKMTLAACEKDRDSSEDTMLYILTTIAEANPYDDRAAHPKSEKMRLALQKHYLEQIRRFAVK